MKALVLTDASAFEIKEVPQPEPGPGEVLVKIHAAGICGSDIHGMDGSSGRRRPPIIMGHEAAGTIAQVGAGVTSASVDDRVTFDSTIYCGMCAYCRSGRINLCEGRRVLGVSCAEYRQDGAFADYISIPEHILYPLPEGVSFEQAAMTEPLSIAVHAVHRTPIQTGDSVLVVGAGMIGLLIVQVLRARGVPKIAVADIDAGKLKAMEGLAETYQVDPKGEAEDLLETMRKENQGLGFDHAIEAVGLESSVNLALGALTVGGTATLVGNLAPTITFPLQRLVTGEITLNGSCASNGEYPECLELIARQKVDVDRMISAVVPLEEGASWFHRLYNREPGLMKVILQP